MLLIKLAITTSNLRLTCAYGLVIVAGHVNAWACRISHRSIGLVGNLGTWALGQFGHFVGEGQLWSMMGI